VVQGRRRLGIMKRNGAELMRRWEERWRMCGRWTKQSRRIFMRLLKEVNGGLVEGGGEMADEVGGGRLERRGGQEEQECVFFSKAKCEWWWCAECGR
jgi:hypothetical protein